MPPKRDPNAPKPPQSPLKFLLGGTTVLVWTVDRGVRAPWPARILTTRELLDNRELVRFHTNSLSYLSRYCYGRFQSQLQAKQLHVSQDHTWAVANKVIEPFPTDPRTCVELYKKYSAERTFAPPYTAEVFRAGWLEAAQNVCGDDFSLDACYDEDGEVAEVDVLRPSLPLAAPESAECNRDADAAAAAASSGSSGTPSAPPPHSAATLAMQWRLASYVGPINYPFPGRPEVYSRFSLLSRPLRSDTMVRLRDRRLVNLYEFVVPEGVPLPDLDQDGAEAYSRYVGEGGAGAGAPTAAASSSGAAASFLSSSSSSSSSSYAPAAAEDANAVRARLCFARGVEALEVTDRSAANESDRVSLAEHRRTQGPAEPLFKPGRYVAEVRLGDVVEVLAPQFLLATRFLSYFKHCRAEAERAAQQAATRLRIQAQAQAQQRSAAAVLPAAASAAGGAVGAALDAPMAPLAPLVLSAPATRLAAAVSAPRPGASVSAAAGALSVGAGAAAAGAGAEAGLGPEMEALLLRSMTPAQALAQGGFSPLPSPSPLSSSQAMGLGQGPEAGQSTGTGTGTGTGLARRHAHPHSHAHSQTLALALSTSLSFPAPQTAAGPAASAAASASVAVSPEGAAGFFGPVGSGGGGVGVNVSVRKRMRVSSPGEVGAAAEVEPRMRARVSEPLSPPSHASPFSQQQQQQQQQQRAQQQKQALQAQRQGGIAAEEARVRAALGVARPLYAPAAPAFDLSFTGALPPPFARSLFFTELLQGIGLESRDAPPQGEDEHEAIEAQLLARAPAVAVSAAAGAAAGAGVGAGSPGGRAPIVAVTAAVADEAASADRMATAPSQLAAFCGQCGAAFALPLAVTCAACRFPRVRFSALPL